MNTVAKIGFVLVLSGPIFFIIPFLMSHDDTTWAIALGLWTIGLVSIILGIVLVIAGVLMIPKTDDEAVIDQLYLEIEKLEKQRKLVIFIFVILSLPAFIMILLAFTVFAGEYYLADTFAFFMPIFCVCALVGIILLAIFLPLHSNAINNRKMRIKFEK